MICNRRLWLLPNINIKCLETQSLLHWSSVYFPCGTYCFWGILRFWVFLTYIILLSSVHVAMQAQFWWWWWWLNVQKLFPVVSSNLAINFVYLFFPLQSSLHIYIWLFRQKPFASMYLRPRLIVEITSDIPHDILFLQTIGSYLPLIICQMSSMYNFRQGMAISSFPHMTIDYWKTTLFTQTQV